MKNSTTLNKILKILLPTLFWLGLWQILSMSVGYEYILPSPAATIRRWCELALTGDFWLSTAKTLLRVIVGFAAGFVLGFALGVVSFKSKIVEYLTAPMIKIIKVVPVASVIIVMFVWIESELLPVVVAGMMVLPIVWQTVFDGLGQVDKKLLEMGRIFGLSKVKIWTKIYFRSILPQLVTAAITALGFAWKSGVATEVISLPDGSIGQFLFRAKTALETTDVFAWTINVILLSLLLETLLKWAVSKRFLKGEEK